MANALKASNAAVARMRFIPVKAARASDEIAAQIRFELSQGRLKLGDRLPAERLLAEQFGVSRNTLREALRSLEVAGLLRFQKGASGGAFIREGSGEVIINGLADMYRLGGISPQDVTQARIWLESIIVRSACERLTAADVAALNLNIDAAQRAQHSGDFIARAAIHLEFHRILARMTGNPIMVIVMQGVLDVLALFIRSIGPYENDFVIPSRRRFMKHMIGGDPDAAVREMERCLVRLQRNYLSRSQHKA
jgi:GntR family transcriptional regulator, transcriptional repressor for pyruvate dehydrogenase complex